MKIESNHADYAGKANREKFNHSIKYNYRYKICRAEIQAVFGGESAKNRQKTGNGKTALEPRKMHSPGIYSDRRPSILLIDDEIQVLQELEAILTEAGYLAKCCATAEEALTATQTTKPDLIICNVVVHAQGGVEICERLQREADPGETPVMFLSANQIPDIIRRRGSLGASYYLRKPFDSEVLLDLLERTLKSAQQPALSIN